MTTEKAARVKIQTTMSDLHGHRTSTQHGIVHFDQDGSALVDAVTAAFLLGMPGFHDPSNPVPAAPAVAPAAADTTTHPAPPEGAKLTLADVNQLAALWEHKVVPIQDADFTVELSNEELAAIATARGLKLVKAPVQNPAAPKPATPPKSDKPAKAPTPPKDEVEDGLAHDAEGNPIDGAEDPAL